MYEGPRRHARALEAEIGAVLLDAQMHQRIALVAHDDAGGGAVDRLDEEPGLLLGFQIESAYSAQSQQRAATGFCPLAKGRSTLTRRFQCPVP